MNASYTSSTSSSCSHAHLMRYGVANKKAICAQAQVALPAITGGVFTVVGTTCVAWGGASVSALTVAGLATGGFGLAALAVAGVAYRRLHGAATAEAQQKAHRQTTVEWNANTLPPIGSVVPDRFALVGVPFTTRKEVYEWLACDDANDANDANEVSGVRRIIDESWVQKQFRGATWECNEGAFNAFVNDVLTERVRSLQSLFLACHSLFEKLAEGSILNLTYAEERSVSASQIVLTEVWAAFDALILRKLEALKPNVPSLSSSAFLSRYAPSVADESSSCEQLVEQDKGDEIVPAVAIDISGHGQVRQKLIWDFPKLENMLEWIENDRLQDKGYWHPNSDLHKFFYTAQDNPQPSDLLKELLGDLANMEKGLRHKDLQSVLDAYIWVAAEGDAEKAYELRFQLMCFFADHHCRRDLGQNNSSLVSSA